MTTEMDLLHMDERQRLAWLMANRGTLIAVGAAWVGLIVWELAHARSPLFLIVMVPVFALLRAGLFFYYCATPVDLGGRPTGGGLGRPLKILAALLLLLCLFLPLYHFSGPAADEAVRSASAWHHLREDWRATFPILVAFLWPVATLALAWKASRRRRSTLVQLAEPLLAALSVLVVLWIPQLVWGTKTLSVFIVGFEQARPAVGCYLAVIANGLYFVAWLSETLRPWVIGSRQPA
jgi:hypothetical protein